MEENPQKKPTNQTKWGIQPTLECSSEFAGQRVYRLSYIGGSTKNMRSQSKQRASGILVGIKRGIRTGNRTQDVSTLRAERSFQLSYAGTRCTVPAELSSLYHQWSTTCNLDIYRSNGNQESSRGPLCIILSVAFEEST
ncbi:uncharacterized protein [Periplaneta americana]|uniref:uncharacterized protein isoform X2 n=1 Tax=Periplaneta americana TaxID=6978 RepID=UPI0037E839D3